MLMGICMHRWVTVIRPVDLANEAPVLIELMRRIILGRLPQIIPTKLRMRRIDIR